LSTKYGDYQLEEKREDANTVSAVIKSESLKGELTAIHKDGRTIVLSVDAVKLSKTVM
jgi:hypothetical protein